MRCPGLDDDYECPNEVESVTTVCESCTAEIARIHSDIQTLRDQKQKRFNLREFKPKSWETQKPMFRVLYPAMLCMFVMLMELLVGLRRM